jgi:NaMN:DMB phosphoribosyltransferase
LGNRLRLHVYNNPGYRDEGDFPPLLRMPPRQHSVMDDRLVSTFDEYLPSSENDVSIIAECVPGGTTTAALAIGLCAGRAVETPSSSVAGSVRSLKHELVEHWRLTLGDAFARLLGEGCIEDALSLCCDHFQFHFVLWLVRHARRLAVAPAIRPLWLGGGSQMLAVLALVKRILGDTTEWRCVRENVQVVTTTWVHSTLGGPSCAGVLDYLSDVRLVHPGFTFRHAKLEALRKYDRGYTQEGCGAGAMLHLAKHHLGMNDAQLTACIERHLLADMPVAADCNR